MVGSVQFCFNDLTVNSNLIRKSRVTTFHKSVRRPKVIDRTISETASAWVTDCLHSYHDMNINHVYIGYDSLLEFY